MRRQIFDAFVRPRLFVGTVEILQRERDVVGEALQQLGELGNERVFLGGHVDHDADGFAANQQWEGSTGLGAIGTDNSVEGGDALIGDIVVGDAGAPGTKGSSTEPAALRNGFTHRKPDMTRRLGRRAGRRHDAQEIASWCCQRDGGRGEPAAVGRGFAHQFEQLGAGFSTHDRFVGRAQRSKHPCQAFFLDFGPRLVGGAVEVFHRERHVGGEPLQQFGEFGRERVLLGGDEEHHARRLARDDQWERRARHRAVAMDELMERRPAGIRTKIVGDAGSPGAEGVAAEPAPLRAVRVGRNLYPAHVAGRRSRHGHRIHVVAVGSGEDDTGGVEPPAFRRGFAHQFEQFAPRRCAHDRLVGRAERAQHTRQPLLLGVGLRLFAGPLEVFQRERDVLRDPPHQRDDLFILGP